MILLIQILLYLAALAGVIAGSFGAIFFAGGALNRARPAGYRAWRALYALLCLCGIVAAAGLGFVAIPALMYTARQ